MTKPLVGNAAAAEYLGLSESTWTAYRARRKQSHAPEPDRREVVGGYARPVWEPATLDAWKASRPGQGAGGGRKPVERSHD